MSTVSTLRTPQHTYAKQHRKTMRQLPTNRPLFIGELDDPHQVHELKRHSIIEHVGEVDYGNNADSRQRKVWLVTEIGHALIEMHATPPHDSLTLPCSRPEDDVYHQAFTSWGNHNGTSLIECQECGAKWTKAEVTD